MTRRDYVAIAKVMSEVRPDPKHGTVGEKSLWQKIVTKLADVMAADRNFDRERFQNACEEVPRAR